MSQLPWQNVLQQTLQQRQADGLYRQPSVRDSAQGVAVVVDGKPYLSFCSNDYLGLANHPALKKAFISAVEKEGVGSGAAHLLTGHSHYHQQLEEALADFTGQQRVLLFSTGYMANIGVIAGLLQRGDNIIQDKLNHASLLDGGRVTAATQSRYAHNDMAMLQRRLQTVKDSAHTLIVSDGVFSMDGDLARVPEILTLAKQHDAAVMIDDAHGLGVIGNTGRGIVEYYQSQLPYLPIVVGTFGKAFGTAGAFVAADAVVIETLIQQARSYVYTTAQPAAVAAATLVSLQLIEQESWRREKLKALIQQFRAGAQQLGLQLMASETPIQPVIVGSVHRAAAIGQQLQQHGILVGVIRPPTVPQGSARLRITFSAEHTESQVDQLLLALENAHAH